MSTLDQGTADPNAKTESPFSRKRLNNDIHSGIPTEELAIVTCMDAWIHESDAFNIELGQAHIIRNAGGSARDALRSLIVSQQFLRTKAIMVVKHTKCGMERKDITSDDMRQKVQDALGACPELDNIDFMVFPDVVQAVKDDVEWLMSHNLIPDDVKKNIRGYIFHVHRDPAMRRLERIVPPLKDEK